MLRLILLLLVPLGVWGQEVSLLTSAQMDWLNKSYQDQHYVTNNWLSFPVPEGSWSVEVRQETSQGHILGAGFAQTGIAGGQFQNGTVAVEQPTTVLSFPYVFVGQDWQWIDLELGLGWYITVTDFSADPYTNADGTFATGRAGGMGWSREASYTTPVFLLRLLPEAGFHLKFRLGREDFSLVEDFFNIEAVLPAGDWQWSAYASLRTPQDFISSDTALTSNQRLGVGGLWKVGTWAWGIKVSYLLNPEYAGTGAVDFQNRLGLSVLWSWNLKKTAP